jgi:predicted DCC family thiol-disulfide oxidoreductase YuxK
MTGAPGLTILYDGACPFCRRYVRLLRLRRAVGEVRLMDARLGGPEVRYVANLGLSLDDGMVLLSGGEVHAGAEAVSRLALLSTGSDRFNRFNHWLFRCGSRSRALYPLLRGGRNLALRVLGQSKLGTGEPRPG